MGVVQQIMGHKSATMTRPVRAAVTTDVAALNWADFRFLRPLCGLAPCETFARLRSA